MGWDNCHAGTEIRSSPKYYQPATNISCQKLLNFLSKTANLSSNNVISAYLMCMESPESREPVQISNLEDLIPEVVPKAEIVGMSVMRDSVQLVIYQLPPMETPIFFTVYHAFSMALNDLPSLELCTDGKNFHPHPLKAGDWIFIPNNQISGSRWSENSLCMHLYLQSTFVNNILSTNFLEDKVDLQPIIGCKDPIVEHFLELFKTEFASNLLTDILYTEALAKALSIHLIRRYSDRQLPRNITEVYLGRSKLQETIDYIDRHLDREITIQGLAQQARVSMSVFAHAFKKEIGISPYQFILKQRLEKSKQLLINKNAKLSISKIAQICGFSTSSAFTNRFRQKEGISPSKYRSHHLQVEESFDLYVDR
jgi:AraC family transcriptional regulator